MSKSYSFLTLSRSDAALIYPVLQARLLEAKEHCQVMGVELSKIPYVMALVDVCLAFQDFLEQ